MNILRPFSITKLSIFLVVISILIRLLTLDLYPLMDTTEARYGEMARIMSETGNWITPMFDYNVPFWGKPPLFAWSSAASFQFLGVSEFAARLPHLLTGFLILCLIWIMVACQKKHLQQAWLSCAILASSIAFIVISGAVMTDTQLTLAITLTMTSFWLAWQSHSKVWGYLFFVGLAIGMLAKGPLILVLIGISLTLWFFLTNDKKRLFTCLPWVGGIFIFFFISLPWYLIAEYKTPGFLNYFIIGEHISRFLVSGWEGDLYGSAHNEIRGTIWIYAIISALPWTPLLFIQLWRNHKQEKIKKSEDKEYRCFLWCWLLSPLLLFTLAGNILYSYVMPALPAMALLLANYQINNKLPEKIYSIGFVTPILILIAALLLHFEIIENKAEKSLIAQWKNQPEINQSELIFLNSRPFSAQYYSNGKAKLKDMTLRKLISQQKDPAFFAFSKQELSKDLNLSDFNCQIRAESKKRFLMYCNPDIETTLVSP